MKDILKRLFIKLPLYVIYFVSLLTIVIPVFYWIITGESFTDLVDEIDNI